MTSAVHFGAFDAEARWRPAELAALPSLRDAEAERVVAAMEELSWGFAAEGDAVYAERRPDEALADCLAAMGVRPRYVAAEEAMGMRAAPYAVVPGVHETALRLGLDVADLPSVDVAARVNGKGFSNALAARLGLPGVAEVANSAASLAAAVRAALATGAAVVKDPYGVSGRGALVIDGEATLGRLIAHVEQKARAGCRVELLVQPLYERAADYSCHIEIAPDGARALGMQRMDNDGMAFQSVREPDTALRERVERAGQERVTEAVAAALREAGYRGPVCVDAMVLADGRVVPLLEINARKSMGLLHLALRRRFALRAPSELLVWSLVLRRRVRCEALVPALRARGLLFDGARGLLPLASGTLAANDDVLAARGRARARLYALIAWDEAAQRGPVLDGTREVLATLGADVVRGPR